MAELAHEMELGERKLRSFRVETTATVRKPANPDDTHLPADEWPVTWKGLTHSYRMKNAYQMEYLEVCPPRVLLSRCEPAH